MSRLWGWIAALFAAMGAALLYVAGQRDRAREATEVAKAQTKSVEAARDKENEIRDAVAKQQSESAQVEADYLARRASGDRPRVFGDVRNTPPGLHDDQGGDSKP